MEYISFELIKKQREKLKMTQSDLAEKLCVSEKTVSKWETKRGYPDITLLPEIAKALEISVTELMSGKLTENKNKAGNVFKTKFYVCPVCGNVLTAIGDACVTCCGISLVAEEAENSDDVIITKDFGEIYVKVKSPMTKEDHLSFIAYVSADEVDFKKLYPEQEPDARFSYKGGGKIIYYSVKNGLFEKRV